MWFVNIVTAIILLFLTIVVKYLNYNYKHWKLQGIPTAKGIVPGFGHMLDVILLKKNYVTLLHRIYESHPNDSVVGLYFLRKPALLVKHPDVIKTVLISEFSSFREHPSLDRKGDFLLAFHPFFASDHTWKHTRRVISSAMNLKTFKFLTSCFQSNRRKFIEFVNVKFRTNKSINVEAKDLYSKFLTQVLSDAIFGIDSKALREKDQPQSFLSIMNSLFKPRPWTATKQNIVLLFPMLSRLFGVSALPVWASKRFQNTVASNREFRKINSIVRNDFLQHAIDYELHDKQTEEDLVPVHAFTFFMEGYETSSLTLAAMSCLFAEEPKIQQKARDEIVRVLSKYGKLTHEALEEMTYLEQCAKETARIFPALARMHKICTKPTVLKGPDGLSCSLKPGDDVLISISGVHKDPAIWSDPDQFNPDRFAKGSEEGSSKYMNLSFGHGPRQCPGIRMSFLHIKAGMAIVLSNYHIGLSSKMQQRVSNVKIDPFCFLTNPIGGFWVELMPLSAKA